MNKITELIVAVKTSHYLPAMLSLVMGLLILKKQSFFFKDNDSVFGDNIPVTLIDSIER